MTATAAITWVPAARNAGYDGKAGKVTLFSVHWVGGQNPWVLRTALPGFPGARWRGLDAETLQARAEKVLARWLDAIGAQMKEA